MNSFPSSWKDAEKQNPNAGVFALNETKNCGNIVRHRLFWDIAREIICPDFQDGEVGVQVVDDALIVDSVDDGGCPVTRNTRVHGTKWLVVRGEGWTTISVPSRSDGVTKKD